MEDRRIPGLDGEGSIEDWDAVETPLRRDNSALRRPNPKYEYYVDYCVFFGSNPRPFEQFSDDFNIVGYLGQWQVQEQCTLLDTHSHPGYLMLKLLGPGLGTGFGAAGGSSLSLNDYPPPWEIETIERLGHSTE